MATTQFVLPQAKPRATLTSTPAPSMLPRRSSAVAIFALGSPYISAKIASRRR